MFCIKCGTEVCGDVRFCPKCGKDLIEYMEKERQVESDKVVEENGTTYDVIVLGSTKTSIEFLKVLCDYMKISLLEATDNESRNNKQTSSLANILKLSRTKSNGQMVFSIFIEFILLYFSLGYDLLLASVITIFTLSIISVIVDKIGNFMFKLSSK